MEEKRLLRTGVCTARASRPAVDRAATGARLASYATDLLALAASAGAGAAAAAGVRRTPDHPGLTIAGYASVDDEPPTRPLLDALHTHGARILLPVVTGATLDWAPYDGWDALVAARWGLREPATTRLGPAAVGEADLVVVPALALDRAGHRLGRGRGFYDRALAGVARERRVGVVYPDEVLAHVPSEPHDEDVGWALTPDGLIPLAG